MINHKRRAGVSLRARTGNLPLIQLEIIEAEFIERTVRRIDRPLGSDKARGIVTGPNIARGGGYRSTAGK